MQYAAGDITMLVLRKVLPRSMSNYKTPPIFGILRNHRILRICIILLVVMSLSSFESAFAEDSNDVSEQPADGNDVSKQPADSNDVPEIPPESTDVSELLEESKAVAAAAEDSNKVPEAATDGNDISEQPADSNKQADDTLDVSELLEETKKEVPRQWFEDEIIMRMLRPYTDARKYLHDEYRFDVAMEHVLVYQRATGGRRPREQSTYNFTFFGQWHISDDPNKDLGIMGFSFEERDNVTNHGVADFSREVGSGFQTHGIRTDERSRTALRQLWWRKRFADDKVTLTLGKLHHSAYYNRNRFAGNARTHFLSYPFSRNINRLIPEDGLGANVNIKVNENFYVSTGFGDARANNKTSGFDTIEEGDFFTAVELGLTSDIEGAGRGNYRFTVWHTDETDEGAEGYGFALSHDQDLNKKFGFFTRYGYTEPEVTGIEHFASGGFIVRHPWGIKEDLLGVGISWDKTGDTGEDEFALEFFYRAQVTRLLQISPSILVVFDPVQSDKTEPVAVFGIRARMLF